VKAEIPGSESKKMGVSSSPSKGNDETRLNQLFQQSVRGDSQAFWRLIEPYSGLIYSVALGIMKDPERASDILHESYVKTYRTLNNLRDPLRLASWLHSMVTHLCYDALRRDAREAHGMVEVMSHTPKVVPIDKVLIKEEELRCLEGALSTLPEPFRVILSMKYMNRYSCQEIATALGLAVGTVKSRLYEARKLLTRRMAEFENSSLANMRGGLKS